MGTSGFLTLHQNQAIPKSIKVILSQVQKTNDYVTVDDVPFSDSVLPEFHKIKKWAVRKLKISNHFIIDSDSIP